MKKKCENQIVSGRLDRLDLRFMNQPVPDTLVQCKSNSSQFASGLIRRNNAVVDS